MASASGLSFVDPEFNEFLFAPVGEQENGMTVSVFSALARLNVDPWREAKRLSDLPSDGAVRALGETITRLVDLKWAKIDAARVAARLVQLLPNHVGQGQRGTAQATSAQREPVRRAVEPAALRERIASVPAMAWLVLAGLILGVMYFMSWNADTSADERPGVTSSKTSPGPSDKR